MLAACCESHWRSPGCLVYERFPSFRRAMLRGCLGRGRAGANAIPFAFILFVRTTCHENRTISQGNSSIAAFFGPFAALGCSSPLCRMRNPALLDTFLYWAACECSLRLRRAGSGVKPARRISERRLHTCLSIAFIIPFLTLFSPTALSMQEDEG